MLSRSHYQRLGLSELFGRTLVAAATGSLIAVGAYPFVPALLRARARKKSLLARIAQPDLRLEWSLGCASSLVRPLGFVGLPSASRAGFRPLVLVHGYAMGRSCFLPMASRLVARGFGPIVGFEYWTLGTVARASKQLGRCIDRILADTGADRVDVVGHSMGGIVARYFTNLDGGADRVSQLITLGSPHAGARVSLFGVGQMRRELRAGSATLTRLAASQTPESVSLTVVHSAIDVLAGSARNRFINDAEVVSIDDVGHIAMLTDRRVLDLIAERLGRRPS